MIARSAGLTNASDAPVQLIEAASASVDLFGTDYELVHPVGRLEHRAQRRAGAGDARRVEDWQPRAPAATSTTPVGYCQARYHRVRGDAYGFNLVYPAPSPSRPGPTPTRPPCDPGLNPEDPPHLRLTPASFQVPRGGAGLLGSGPQRPEPGYHKLLPHCLCRAASTATSPPPGAGQQLGGPPTSASSRRAAGHRREGQADRHRDVRA